jgi:hypothetical protein
LASFENFYFAITFCYNGAIEVKQLPNMFIFIYFTALVNPKKIKHKIQVRHFGFKFLSQIFQKERIFEIFG